MNKFIRNRSPDEFIPQAGVYEPCLVLGNGKVISNLELLPGMDENTTPKEVFACQQVLENKNESITSVLDELYDLYVLKQQPVKAEWYVIAFFGLFLFGG